MRTLTALLFVLSSPALAFADVPPPDLCEGEGSPCTIVGGGVGICQPATCTRIDYSGESPTGVSYPCHRCQPAIGGATGGGSTPLFLGFGVCCTLLFGAGTFGALAMYLRGKKKKADG